MNATTMTAKNAVTKNTDLTNRSLMRETKAVFPGSFPTGFSLSVMVCHLSTLLKKVDLRNFIISSGKGDVPLCNNDLLALCAEEEVEVILRKTRGLSVSDHVEIAVDRVGLVLDGRNARGDDMAVCG